MSKKKLHSKFAPEKKKRKYIRKCGLCGERFEQSEMIRDDDSPNGWFCADCYRDRHLENEIEEW